jgi:hypothetical protein
LFRGLGQFKHLRVVHVDESPLIRSCDYSRLATAPRLTGLQMAMAAFHPVTVSAWAPPASLGDAPPRAQKVCW